MEDINEAGAHGHVYDRVFFTVRHIRVLSCK